MQYQLNNIINNLTETFEGTPWHGLSLTTILQEIDIETAFYRPFKHKHNIAELVAHLLIWRQFALEMLNKNYAYHIDIGTNVDFPVIEKSDKDEVNDKVWFELNALLRENQTEILLKLDQFDATLLDEIIPKKPFTYRYLFEGVVNHDVYHAGQIALINAAHQTQETPIDELARKIDFNTLIS